MWIFKKQIKRYWIQTGDYGNAMLLQRQKTNIKGNTSIQSFKLSKCRHELSARTFSQSDVKCSNDANYDANRQKNTLIGHLRPNCDCPIPGSWVEILSSPASSVFGNKNQTKI